MRSSIIFAASATFFLTATALALEEPILWPSQVERDAPSVVEARASAFTPSDPTSLIGCYSSVPGMTYKNSTQFQSSGACQITCAKNLGLAVEAIVNGTDCWCGTSVPPSSALVDPKNCDTICPGFGDERCGSYQAGPQFWSVYNSGMKKAQFIATASADPSSTAASSTSGPTGTPTGSGGSAATTAATNPTSTPTGTSGDSGPSKAGIAAGVVVGIIAIAAIAGGIWFYMRNKRRRAVEEEYKRQAAISAFTAAGKPGSSAGSSVPDTRLDPAIMTQRRLSDGSIMDNQDYSRRILKVTNA